MSLVKMMLFFLGNKYVVSGNDVTRFDDYLYKHLSFSLSLIHLNFIMFPRHHL